MELRIATCDAWRKICLRPIWLKMFKYCEWSTSTLTNLFSRSLIILPLHLAYFRCLLCVLISVLQRTKKFQPVSQNALINCRFSFCIFHYAGVIDSHYRHHHHHLPRFKHLNNWKQTMKWITRLLYFLNTLIILATSARIQHSYITNNLHFIFKYVVALLRCHLFFVCTVLMCFGWMNRSKQEKRTHERINKLTGFFIHFECKLTHVHALYVYCLYL